ncbi:penicillin-binding transpeptidase domain-containing protein, partial [Alphaproteobacteria bacterium]|nr:penicillin-binding transpeptidase domain-containing protein [Alphaproteobacteria bacterium]
PQNGQILALAGGFDFWGSEFNRASQARRQPGSAFKPIVYFTALNSGFRPQDLIEDAPIVRVDDEGEIWEPKNADGGYRGTLTLKQAMQFSRNIPAIRLAEEVGLDRLLAYAQFLGMAKDQGAYPALALGVGETSAIEIAGAYAILANKGRVVVPSTINQIQDVSDGLLVDMPALTCNYCKADSALNGRIREILYDRKPEIVVTPQSFEHIRTMLRAVVAGGTGRRVGQGLPNDTSGKTGTTNDYRDAWFVGFSDKIGDTSLLVATYVGYDQPKSLGRGGTGGRAAGPIFRNFMKKAMAIRSKAAPTVAKSLDKLPTSWKEWAPYTVRDDGGLNLRQGPGTQHSIVGYMPSSAEIAVHLCQAQWCQLSFDGTVGYAHQDYIVKQGEHRANKVDVAKNEGPTTEHPALAQSPITLEMVDDWEANFGPREVVESRQEIRYGGIY